MLVAYVDGRSTHRTPVTGRPFAGGPSDGAMATERPPIGRLPSAASFTANMEAAARCRSISPRGTASELGRGASFRVEIWTPRRRARKGHAQGGVRAARTLSRSESMLIGKSCHGEATGAGWSGDTRVRTLT